MNYDNRDVILKNTTFLEKVLEDTKHSHKQAEKTFDDARREILRVTSTSINVFGADCYSRIVQAVHTSMNAAENLYITCQALVQSLDELCRPRLEEGTLALVVYDIAEEIRKLNEDSIINVDYTGTLDGIDLGDMAKVSLKPSIEAKSIETYWRVKAKELIEIEKEVLQKQADEEYIKKHQIEAKDIENHKRYESIKKTLGTAKKADALLELQKELLSLNGYLDSADLALKCEELAKEMLAKEAEEERIRKEKERQRKLAEAEKKKKEQAAKDHMDKTISECNSKVDEFEKELDSALKTHMSQLHAKINSKLDELSKQKAEKEEYCSSLGFFKFSDKKETKKQILQLVDEIERLKNPELLKKEKATVKKAFDKAKKDYSNSVKEYLEARFPGRIPKPVEYDFPDTNEGLKNRILFALTKIDVIWTIDKIKEATGVESIQKTNALVRELKDDGELVRFEGQGKPFYLLADSSKSVLNRLPVKPAVPQYAEDEKYAKEGCPLPPQIKEIKLPDSNII